MTTAFSHTLAIEAAIARDRQAHGPGNRRHEDALRREAGASRG